MTLLIKEVLTSEEMTAFIGRLAIELYLEIYKLSNEYRDKYTKSFKTLRDDTVTKFYTTGELLVINDIDLNKLEEMATRNKMLDIAIDRLGNNQNLFGSTLNKMFHILCFFPMQKATLCCGAGKS